MVLINTRVYNFQTRKNVDSKGKKKFWNAKLKEIIQSLKLRELKLTVNSL